MSEERLNEYYELKKMYKKKNKNRCPICKTSGELVFGRGLNENNSIVLTSTCPNKECKANMTIELGYYEDPEYIISRDNRILNNLKVKIQQTKMEHIYGVIDDDMLEKETTQLLDDIKAIERNIMRVQKTIETKQQNKEREDKLSKNMMKIETLLMDIKGLVRNSDYITAIKDYDELYSIVKESRTLRYQVMKVMKNPENEQDVVTGKEPKLNKNNLYFTLIREKNTLENRELNLLDLEDEDNEDEDEDNEDEDENTNNVEDESSINRENSEPSMDDNSSEESPSSLYSSTP
jgi:hypothetical protein